MQKDNASKKKFFVSILRNQRWNSSVHDADYESTV